MIYLLQDSEDINDIEKEEKPKEILSQKRGRGRPPNKKKLLVSEIKSDEVPYINISLYNGAVGLHYGMFIALFIIKL
jgi:hypothetical protein